METMPQFVSNLISNNFINEFKTEINKIITIKNDYTRAAGYPSFHAFINANSAQPAADFTKNLSVDMDIAYDIIMKKFNMQDSDNTSHVGYDRVLDSKKIECKISGTIDDLFLANNGIIRSGIWSGNHFQGKKDECDYFQFLTYYVDDTSGLIADIWGVVINNNDAYKEYYRSICEKGHTNNSAHLSIRIPNTFKLNEDFWCLNCRGSLVSTPKGPKWEGNRVTLESLLNLQDTKKLKNWYFYPNIERK